MANTSKLTGLGIALGMALGAAFGVFAGHMAVWLAMGIAIGIALGAAFRRKEPECAECAAMHKIHETKRTANS
jgi:lipoprotein signal peptidase